MLKNLILLFLQNSKASEIISLGGSSSSSISILSSIASMSIGAYEKPSFMTMNAWIEKYQNEYMDNVKDSTRNEYLGTFRRYITPYFGKYRLFEMNPSLIKNVYIKLQKNSVKGGVSAKTIRNINGLLNSMMEKAVLLGYIQRSPLLGVTLPRIEKRKCMQSTIMMLVAF